MFTLIHDEAGLDQYMQAQQETHRHNANPTTNWINKDLVNYPMLISCSFIPFHARNILEYHYVDARDAHRLLLASGARVQRSLVF